MLLIPVMKVGIYVCMFDDLLCVFYSICHELSDVSVIVAPVKYINGCRWSGMMTMTCLRNCVICHCSPVWARGRCRISPPRFLAECCKRQLNQVSLVLLYFRLSAFSDLY